MWRSAISTANTVNASRVGRADGGYASLGNAGRGLSANQREKAIPIGDATGASLIGPLSPR
eukprot:scaffold3122_cov136-Isochrysis_galbana.AAC.5